MLMNAVHFLRKWSIIRLGCNQYIHWPLTSESIFGPTNLHLQSVTWTTYDSWQLGSWGLLKDTFVTTVVLVLCFSRELPAKIGFHSEVFAACDSPLPLLEQAQFVVLFLGNVLITLL